jgi:hypothetical protein
LYTFCNDQFPHFESIDAIAIAKERVDEAKEVVASAKEMLEIMGIVVEEDERVVSSQG